MKYILILILFPAMVLSQERKKAPALSLTDKTVIKKNIKRPAKKKRRLALRFKPEPQKKDISGSKNQDADIKVTIIKPLTLSLVGSNSLNFGKIYVTGSSLSYSITNQFGQKFLALGQKDRYVSVSYSETVTLSNSVWVAQHGGGEISTLTFNSFPLVHTKKHDTWRDVTEINQGEMVKLEKVSIDGEYVGMLYFWAGGEITVPGNKPPGEYTGYYELSIAY